MKEHVGYILPDFPLAISVQPFCTSYVVRKKLFLTFRGRDGSKAKLSVQHAFMHIDSCIADQGAKWLSQ